MKQILAISIAFWMGYAMCYFTKSKESYKQGFEAGMQYMERMRKQSADSIRNNCTWNNGIPDTVIAIDDSVLKENFPKPNMNKMLRGE